LHGNWGPPWDDDDDDDVTGVGPCKKYPAEADSYLTDKQGLRAALAKTLNEIFEAAK